MEYDIKFMGQDIPEEPGMLSRRFMEITLKPDEQPTSEIFARGLVMRGGRCVSAASQIVREIWWIGKKPALKKSHLSRRRET